VPATRLVTNKGLAKRMGGAVRMNRGVWLSLLCTLAVGAAFSACASQGVETKVATAPHREATAYRIGKDDLLDIIVWKERQLSGKVHVVEDGTVTIPLIGPVPAEGQTCEQLQADLTKRLAQYTRDPNVTVRVASASSRVFYILGEVRKPGSYPLRSDEVLSQAVAQAGGFTDFADLSAIRIVRRTRDQSSAITLNYKKVMHGQDLSADIPLEAGDTISVP
jgi:polysaccharide export outer membrane protein